MTLGITEGQRQALQRLAHYVDPDTYLAGGVAVALRLRHRQSRDIDLFSPKEDPAARVEGLAAQADIRVVSQSEGTLHLEVGGVPASWIRYRYPMLSPLERVPDFAIPLASLEDLTCMKLSAIAGRGAARDFWDLHETLTRRASTLSAAVDAFARKYPFHDVGHVLKSLVYFADADAEPAPAGLTSQHWTTIKRDLVIWAKAL